MMDPNTSSRKKLIRVVVVLGILTVAVVTAVLVYPATQDDSSTLDKQIQEKMEIAEKILNVSGEEKEDQEEMIAGIETLVSGVMSGSNNLGVATLKDIWVDRRVTEREEYFAIVEFNADENNTVSDYLDQVPLDMAAIRLKCAEFFQAVYSTENKVYLATCKAFQSDDALTEMYRVDIERETSESVDWSKDAQTLVTDVLPDVWAEGRNDLWLFE